MINNQNPHNSDQAGSSSLENCLSFRDMTTTAQPSTTPDIDYSLEPVAEDNYGAYLEDNFGPAYSWKNFPFPFPGRSDHEGERPNLKLSQSALHLNHGKDIQQSEPVTPEYARAFYRWNPFSSTPPTSGFSREAIVEPGKGSDIDDYETTYYDADYDSDERNGNNGDRSNTKHDHEDYGENDEYGYHIKHNGYCHHHYDNDAKSETADDFDLDPQIEQEYEECLHFGAGSHLDELDHLHDDGFYQDLDDDEAYVEDYSLHHDHNYESLSAEHDYDAL